MVFVKYLSVGRKKIKEHKQVVSIGRKKQSKKVFKDEIYSICVKKLKLLPIKTYKKFYH